MKWTAMVVGMLMLSIGIVGIAVPGALYEVARTGQAPPWVYVAAGVRMAMGAVLYLAAPRTRLPLVMAVFGAVLFTAGLITPLAGSGAAVLILDGWNVLGALIVRLIAALSLFIGGVIIYATLPPIWGGEVEPPKSQMRK